MLDNVVANAALIANLLQVMLSKVYQEQIGPKSLREKEIKRSAEIGFGSVQ
jgi:hypothetical protein